MRDANPDIENKIPAWRRWGLRLLVGGAMTAYLGGMSVLGILAHAGWDLPSVETLSTPNRPVSVQVIDRQGRDVLVRGAHAETSVSAEDLPPHLKDAVFATEDRRFYHHIGVDPIMELNASSGLRYCNRYFPTAIFHDRNMRVDDYCHYYVVNKNLDHSLAPFLAWSFYMRLSFRILCTIGLEVDHYGHAAGKFRASAILSHKLSWSKDAISQQRLAVLETL